MGLRGVDIERYQRITAKPLATACDEDGQTHPRDPLAHADPDGDDASCDKATVPPNASSGDSIWKTAGVMDFLSRKWPADRARVFSAGAFGMGVLFLIPCILIVFLNAIMVYSFLGNTAAPK